jgi:hypothetical protein
MSESSTARPASKQTNLSRFLPVFCPVSDSQKTRAVA